MLEGIIEWLTGAGGRVNFFVFPVVENGEAFAWTDPGLVGAFIGAAASTLIALSVLVVSTKIEQLRRAKDKAEFDGIRAEDQALIAAQRTEDRFRREAADALNTFSKISRYANAILAVKNAIDVRYSEVTADAPDLSDPCQIVGPIPGKFVVPERLKPEEYSFLFTNENFLIAGEIEDLESACILMMSLIEEYNERQTEIHRWLDDMADADRQINGMVATDMIPNEMKGRLDRRIAQLNILITSIIEIAEQSSPSPKEVMERFVAAAVASPFAAYFPKMELA
jgi:hypothetical protein